MNPGTARLGIRALLSLSVSLVAWLLVDGEVERRFGDCSGCQHSCGRMYGSVIFGISSRMRSTLRPTSAVMEMLVDFTLKLQVTDIPAPRSERRRISSMAFMEREYPISLSSLITSARVNGAGV